MAPEAAFAQALGAAALGLALSALLEQKLHPRPHLARPAGAWALHAGMWCTAHAMLCLLLGRPWFAMATALAFVLMLVLVSHAKYQALREPFVYSDHEYFTDALRHPRLYIPFLGWGKFLAAATGFALAIAIGLWLELPPPARLRWQGQLGGIAAVLVIGLLLWRIGHATAPQVTFDAEQDMRKLGLLACLWRYRQAQRLPPRHTSPFAAPHRPASTPQPLPHLVAVQSESFFDARSLHAGIRGEVLADFDALRAEALSSGALQVPAWGANTVRSEFGFLCGIAPDSLGVHRFNPYRAIAAGWPVASLAGYLRQLGYRTVCIHPYPASFYLRDRVLPLLGFDEFLDIRQFEPSQRCGPYIGDAAVAERICALLDRAAAQPLFIFAITMENHGPLHLERITPEELQALYDRAPPPGCEELGIYLRHLRNANRMAARLRAHLARNPQPASLCWYGDHVPIMPAVYQACGTPSGLVEYLCWSNRPAAPRTAGSALPTAPGASGADAALAVHALAAHWLSLLDLWQPSPGDAPSAPSSWRSLPSSA
ncbi:LTA synthase family protein [Vandammella animalimorsus]|uniref:LTA synthase family protein n=1 Tax=Vandammella animalimorsus TaxID=2029117 RepID=A0A3M6R703_9BURK|nr:LTA synthase family protein [Vandammella animalimorsus]RMX11141.1 LTA synthase family protein [Vandammella animalimorsus]